MVPISQKSPDGSDLRVKMVVKNEEWCSDCISASDYSSYEGLSALTLLYRHGGDRELEEEKHGLTLIRVHDETVC